MDDILICTKIIEENIKCTKRILERLQENDLYLKPEKCLFWRTEVEYLGMVISENKLKMDPVKVAGIADWPTPKTIKDVRSFLGFGNYYQRFIHAYGNLTKPLNDLLKKNVIFEWNQKRQEISDITGITNARHDETIRSRIRRIKICIRCCITTTRYQWRLASLCLSVQILQRN